MKKLYKKIALPLILLPSLFFGKSALACSSFDPMLGTMCVFAGNFAPRGYALAQGQLLAISQNSALFSILGTTYGGDGRTTFGLPDTRGRSVIGAGNGPGLQNYALGQRGGAETHTLHLIQMPSHNHSATTTIENDVTVGGVADLNAVNGRSSSNVPSGAALGQSPNRQNIYSSTAPSVPMHADSIALNLTGTVNSTATTTVNNNGGNLPFSIRAPYIAINWIIALQGTFPSRS
ncbi:MULTISPECIES: tail fiber protein [Thalassotalea]|uniref:Tail fiber protein n=1 Tax=Thalassotalea castellviae TaxID=3075612 RepID=A0ABU3A1K1_9GAMM|nr:tail fiber protein [Thalassotalea sp. W431]MDT0604054.1 tail fiber protein [Thalassotalea sp. W431]